MVAVVVLDIYKLEVVESVVAVRIMLMEQMVLVAVVAATLVVVLVSS
jgi:hypothetical protein